MRKHLECIKYPASAKMPSNVEIGNSLFQAVSNNNLSLVKDIVNRYGLAYCETWCGGYKLLCIALKWKRDEISEYLLNKGAKVNCENCGEKTKKIPLHIAAGEGSDKIFEMLIDKHAAVDAFDGVKQTALHVAAAQGSPNKVRLLLKAGANCCPLNNEGYEPLHYACKCGDTESVKLILQYRKQKGVRSLDPLHLGLALASCQGNEEVVFSLLNAGANPNADNSAKYKSVRSHFGMQEEGDKVPLLSACRRGHVAVVKLLLKHGAALNCSRKKDGFKPLHLAAQSARNEDAEIVSHLLSIGADPNVEADNNITPLHLAAKGCVAVLEELLRYGANVNARTDEGMTPLSFASKHRLLEVAQVLLERGANVNAKANDAKSPLFYAIENRHSSLIYLLLKYNPEIDDITKESIIKAISAHNYNEFIDALMDYRCCISHEDIRKNPNLLPNAVEKGYKNVVECFLIYGGDGGYPVQNLSLLHVAVQKGHAAIIEPLLKLGYEINSKDRRGKMPIHYSMSCDESKKSNWIEIFQILLAHGAIVENASELLHEAVNKECLEICRILIENCNVDTNALNRNSHTPLQILVTKKRDFYHRKHIKIDKTDQIAKLLLSNGAEVHSVTKTGYFMLHYAAYNGKAEIVRILLQFGANVNERARSGYTSSRSFHGKNRPSNNISVSNGPTALHLAAQKGHDKIVQILLKFDADIDAHREGDKAATALHEAALANSAKVARVLLDNGCDVNIQNIIGETALDIAVEQAKKANKPDDHQIIIIRLKMHAIRSKVAGLLVTEKDLQHIENLNPSLTSFQEECKKEINALKNVKLCCHLALYDILLDLKNPAYTKNECLSRTLYSLNFDKYPIYGSLIKNSFEKNRRKTVLLIPGKRSLDILIKTKTAFDGKKSSVLVDDVCEGIFLYLSISELKNLIAAGESIKNQVCK